MTLLIRRRRLPMDRQSVTRKFKLKKPPRVHICPQCSHVWEESADLKVYATVGVDERGAPMEIFLTADKAGSTTRGLLIGIGIMVSLGLQCGIPLAWYVKKMRGTQFGASGMTDDPEYKFVGSILDLVGRWLSDRFPAFMGEEETMDQGTVDELRAFAATKKDVLKKTLHENGLSDKGTDAVLEMMAA